MVGGWLAVNVGISFGLVVMCCQHILMATQVRYRSCTYGYADWCVKPELVMVLVLSRFRDRVSAREETRSTNS